MLSFGSFLKTAAKLRLFCRIEMPKPYIVCDNSLYFDLYQSPASGSGLEINPGSGLEIKFSPKTSTFGT